MSLEEDLDQISKLELGPITRAHEALMLNQDDSWSAMEEMTEAEFNKTREFWVDKARQEMKTDVDKMSGSGKLSVIDWAIMIYAVAIAIAIYLTKGTL